MASAQEMHVRYNDTVKSENDTVKFEDDTVFYLIKENNKITATGISG